MYLPEKKTNYYRIGFYDNILDSDKLSMYIEIGYSKNATIDVEEQLKLTIDNLRKSNIVSEDMELEEYSSIIMDPAYVHITSDTDKKVTELKKKFENDGIYTIGRYGGWTYCSMEDCMLEAKNLAQKL